MKQDHQSSKARKMDVCSRKNIWPQRNKHKSCSMSSQKSGHIQVSGKFRLVSPNTKWSLLTWIMRCRASASMSHSRVVEWGRGGGGWGGRVKTAKLSAQAQPSETLPLGPQAQRLLAASLCPYKEYSQIVTWDTRNWSGSIKGEETEEGLQAFQGGAFQPLCLVSWCHSASARGEGDVSFPHLSKGTAKTGTCNEDSTKQTTQARHPADHRLASKKHAKRE